MGMTAGAFLDTEPASVRVEFGESWRPEVRQLDSVVEHFPGLQNTGTDQNQEWSKGAQHGFHDQGSLSRGIIVTKQALSSNQNLADRIESSGKSASGAPADLRTPAKAA